MQCDYYVYVHKKKSDNSVFYVGKGRLIRESISHKRTQAWKEAAKEKAYEYRRERLIELNAQGAGYVLE